MTIKATFRPNAALKGQLRKALDKGAEAIAKEVVVEARKRSPVDTGFLRKTHYIRRLGASAYGRYRVGASAFYARFVHFGTSKQSAQPWLADAIRAVRARAPRKAAKAIRTSLRSASLPFRRPPGR